MKPIYTAAAAAAAAAAASALYLYTRVPLKARARVVATHKQTNEYAAFVYNPPSPPLPLFKRWLWYWLVHRAAAAAAERE